MSLQFLSFQSICKLLKLNLSKKSYVKSRHRQLELLGLEERVVPAPITVLNTAASGAGSLDAAITLANTTPGNDDIVFNTGVTGTIALTAALPAIINATSVILDSNNNPIGTAGTVTITGPSASSLTISGSLGGFRIFTIDTGGNLSISGVTVSGANTSSYGGGFFNSGILTVNNSTISGNNSTGNGGGSGGGIMNYGTLTVNNSTISGNTAVFGGGGIRNNGTLTLTNSTLSNNSAGNGGAIFNDGTVTLSNSTLSGNTAGNGGAIQNGGTLTVSNSTLSGNTAGNNGGGIFNSSTLTVTNSTLSGNTATNTGGGLQNGSGGGFSFMGATLTVTNSTLSGNTATTGGGIYNFGNSNPRGKGTLNIANTIIANSTDGASTPALIDDYAGGGTVNVTSPATAANNLVSQGSFSWATTKTSAEINLGTLANNGGPTQTLALLNGSAAIATGDATVSNASPVNGLDQRGVTRSTTAPSIGAFEYVPPTPTPTPTPTPPTPTPTPTPTAPLVVGTPPPASSGGSSTVTLYDPITGEPTGTAVPFPGFSGPIKVVSGDFNNDGVADIIAGAGFGGGPAIAILDSATGEVLEAFFAFDEAFTGGVFVAVQDVNGDGILDIIAGAGPSGGPEVRIFDGANLNVLRSFYAYAEDFTGGVSVASIDFNNDGILDLVTGAGPGGAPHVKVYDGATNAIISQWYAYPVSFTGGVFVAVGDIGNDGTFEVVTGAGQGGTPVVAVWDPFTGALLAQFYAYAEDFTGGVRVGINDGNSDGIADIVTGAGPGGGPQVNVFSFPALDLLFSFYSGDPANTGGVFVS